MIGMTGVTPGWIDVYECYDSQCGNCLTERFDTEFGKCKPAGECPDLNVMWTCDAEGYLVRHYWMDNGDVDNNGRNPKYCEGRPHVTYTHLDGCFQNRWEGWGLNFLNGECMVRPGGVIEDSYLHFRCGSNEEDDWRKSALSGQSDDAHMNVGIAVAVLLIVCLIGVIAGYLVHRKRKKIQQKKHLLCDANDVIQTA